jgi:Rieske Fe-S protein
VSQQQGTEVAEQVRRRRNRWRLEFPYHWDADEMVARREVLRLAIIASGALFAGTALLAALSRIDDRKRGGEQAIARVDEVPPGEALYFTYPGDDDQAMLINHPISGFVAYSQKCTHLSCAVFYQKDEQRLYCPCHEGIFETTSGQPIAGPPQRRLPQIRLQVRGGVIYALEEIP